jgi:type IV secretion system protein VirD4
VSGTLPRDGRDHALGLAGAGVTLAAVLWVAGACSALIAGYPPPRSRPFGGVAALAHLGNPSDGWGAPVGPAPLYWAVTTIVVALAGLGCWLAWRVFHQGSHQLLDDATKAEGLAARRQVRHFAGQRALLGRAGTLRPSLSHPRPVEVGYRLGSARGVDCWASVEDSMLLLGPPRSGKGQNLVIPMILDAPGAVVTTSTRPDNLAVTFAARGSAGPVAVFDPEGLAPAASLIPLLRWSVLRGCEHPQTAMRRAAALVPGGAESGIENGAFWRQQTLSAVRCLLHAAALDGRPPAELYRWSHAAARAKEAVTILGRSAGATPGWDSALDAIIGSEPRTRDAVWAMVANTFATLADPAVLAAVSPREGEAFHPSEFLDDLGTLYLLGTAAEATGTANLIAALVEDIIDTARRVAAVSSGARLDPPLALILDEAANYALPSLPALMSEGGGSGITTLAVLQSLAQARDRWGRDASGAIWDAAIVKIVLGGSGNADDLTDISRLIGDRDVREWSETVGAERGRSVSVSTRQRPILDVAAIRRLNIGHGLLLLRSAPPIVMTLTPWTARPEHRRLAAARLRFETAMLGHHRRGG